MVRPPLVQQHLDAARQAMLNTVYVLEPDPAERRWIESALAGQVRTLVLLEDGTTLAARLAAPDGDCLVCGTEPDASTSLALVRSLRRQGVVLPVVMLGPHSAFRTAVDLARLADTDFLERPVSAQRLRAAITRLVTTAEACARR
jgi:DNA-binding NtrC family response regulator